MQSFYSSLIDWGLVAGTVSAKFSLQFHCYGSESQFRYPIGITTNNQGNIILADTGGNRVYMFDPHGSPVCKALLRKCLVETPIESFFFLHVPKN